MSFAGWEKSFHMPASGNSLPGQNNVAVDWLEKDAMSALQSSSAE